MINEKSIFWERFEGYPTCVCPHCNSDNCDYNPEDDSLFCQNCKRDEKGRIHSEYPFVCPDCGWHVLNFDRRGNRYYPWECKKCLSAFAGTKETGPEGKPRRSLPCPTCGQTGVIGVIDGDLSLPRYYQCQHCETEYYADKRGMMIQPEQCSACGRLTVQLYRHLYRDQVPGGFEQHEAVVKRCRHCWQIYDMDMRPVDTCLNPIIDTDDDDAIPENSGVRVVPRSTFSPQE